MNKILLVVILAIISLGLFLIGNLGIHENPFDAYTSLDYPQFTIADDDDNIYVIDTSLRRVLVADSNGTLLTSIQGGDRTEGAFYYARSITPGTDGKFFVLNYVLDTNGMFLLREELIEYDLKGNFQRIFYQRLYETRKSTLVQRGELFSPVVTDDRLYFFLINDQQIRLIRKSLQNEVTELLGTVPYDDAIAYVADIEWISPEFFLILDKRGFFIKGDIYGNYQTLRYQSEEARTTVTEVNNSGIDFLPTEYFWDMSISGDGNIYITDLINRQIVFFPFSALFSSVLDDAVITYSTALDQSLLTASGFSDEPFIYYVNGSARNGFLATYDYGLYYANAEEVIGEHTAFRIPAPQIALAVIRWAGIILGALILVALLLYLFVQIFTGRLSLIAKQVLITVPLLGGGVFIIANVLLGRFISQYEESSIDKMLSLAQTISTSINGDHFYGIQNLGDYMNDDYRNIREQLRSALNYNQNSWNEGLYFALYQVIDETLYGFMYLNNGIGLRHPFTWYGDPQSVYRTAFEGTIVFEQAEDISGNFLYAIAPIYDSQDRPVALLEIGSDLYSFSQNAQRIYNQSLLYMSLISIVFIVAIILMTFAILHGLRILRKGVERIAEGDWAYRIELNSNDEVSELGKRFNYMSDSINKQLNHIELLNNSYKKFFPDAFLQHLDLQSVTEVKLGDQVEKTMSVLFSDIRAFTTISEKLSPEQNFGF